MTSDLDKGIQDSRAKTLPGIVTVLPGDKGKLPFSIGKYLKLECMTVGEYSRQYQLFYFSDCYF